MEELPDDVGGGGDAEHNGSEDLLPPGQQQHRVLPPATLTSFPVSLYQADCSAALLPVTLAVREVVPVVCGEERAEFSAARWDNTLLLSHRVLTIGVLKDGQGSVAVFIMGELVIVQTLVKFIRSDQGWCPRWGICVKDKMNRSLISTETKSQKSYSEESRTARSMCRENKPKLHFVSSAGSKAALTNQKASGITQGT